MVKLSKYINLQQMSMKLNQYLGSKQFKATEALCVKQV
jgi:hypothetical protein